MIKNCIKKLNLILIIFIVIFSISGVKATEECFEKTSRAIFKFNMAFDDVILEPIAKGYNKLPEPIKDSTSNFTSNIGMLLSIPNNLLQGNGMNKNSLIKTTFLRNFYGFSDKFEIF